MFNNEKMLVLRIEFKDEILYYGAVYYRYNNYIIDRIEKINTSF